MLPENSRLIRLDLNHVIKPFKCEDDDLNDFLFNDAKNYLKELLAVTNIIETDTETIAFFSLLNDKVTYSDNLAKSKWTRTVAKLLPHNKRGYKSFPAMKIGRLAVNEKYKRYGLGTQLIDYLKMLFVDNNRTGCRFITVDAYIKSAEFYKKNGFQILPTDGQNSEHTVLMYFDLITVANLSKNRNIN